MDVEGEDILRQILDAVKAVREATQTSKSIVVCTPKGRFRVSLDNEVEKMDDVVVIGGGPDRLGFEEANELAKQRRTILETLSVGRVVQGKNNVRRGKGDRIRDRQNWRGKWRK